MEGETVPEATTGRRTRESPGSKPASRTRPMQVGPLSAGLVRLRAGSCSNPQVDGCRARHRSLSSEPARHHQRYAVHHGRTWRAPFVRPCWRTWPPSTGSCWSTIFPRAIPLSTTRLASRAAKSQAWVRTRLRAAPLALGGRRQREDRKLPGGGSIDLECQPARQCRCIRALRSVPAAQSDRGCGKAAGGATYDSLVRSVHGLRRHTFDPDGKRIAEVKVL